MNNGIELLGIIEKTKKPVLVLEAIPIFNELKNTGKSNFTKCEDDYEVLPFYTSKFGGLAYLPMYLEYPKGKSGAPMFLLAQINFEEMPKLDLFPTEGILQIFMDINEYEDFHVRYIPKKEKFDDPQNLDFLRGRAQSKYYFPVEIPHKIKGYFKKVPLPEFSESFNKVFEKYMPTEEDGYQFSDLYLDVIQEYPEHHIGGEPRFCQDGPGYKKMGDYEVLLHMGCTDYICYGDSGVMVFFIKKEDLKNKDFSKVEFYYDCY